jgi:hypothetical protein
MYIHNILGEVSGKGHIYICMYVCMYVYECSGGAGVWQWAREGVKCGSYWTG